ncbi:MAG: 4Fe-4S dicluster domain-containing protein [Chloroflexi bacterium]|nr:4Fe-4S dicluster domain-containing protein [Chloroflexota bacterium]
MKRVYINPDVCLGCGLCEVFCKVSHSRSRDLVKAFKKETPRPVARIRVERRAPVSFAVQCRHCAEPLCVYSCLTGALRKEPNGVVTVDAERCIGCWTCILACHVGAIRQDKEQGKIAKCDLCQGLDMPACVANCPNESLAFVEVQESVSGNGSGDGLALTVREA